MRIKSIEINFRDVFGYSGIVAFVISVIMFFVALYLDYYLKLSKFNINFILIILTFFLLFFIGILVNVMSFVFLPLSDRGKTVINSGIYHYVRHPQYGSVIFCFYPAFAILSRSIIAIVFIILVYINYCILIRWEDKYMLKKFGNRFEKYKKSTPAFFPKIRM